MIPEIAWPVACGVFTVILVGGEITDKFWVRAVSKTLAVASFLGYAIMRGAWDMGDAGKIGFVALVLCGVGDLCLLSRERLPFAVGILAFLAGHVGYIAMFYTIGFDPVPSAMAALPLGAFAIIIWQWLRPGVGALGPAVAAYILVITSMVACAVGLGLDGHPILFVAALVFFLSDLCVARDRFVEKSWKNRLVGLPLYFGAQCVFAYGMTA